MTKAGLRVVRIGAIEREQLGQAVVVFARHDGVELSHKLDEIEFFRVNATRGSIPFQYVLDPAFTESPGLTQAVARLRQSRISP